MTGVMERKPAPNRLDLEVRAMQGEAIDPLDLELANDWSANAELRWTIPDEDQYPKPTDLDAVALFEKGVELMRDNRMSAALEHFDEAAKSIGQWPRLHMNRYLVMERLRKPKAEYRKVLLEGLHLTEMESAGVISPLETRHPITDRQRRLLQAQFLQNLGDEYWEDAVTDRRTDRLPDALHAFAGAHAIFAAEHQLAPTEVWLRNATAFMEIRMADVCLRMGNKSEAERLTHCALKRSLGFSRMYLNGRNYLEDLRGFDTLGNL